MTKTNQISDSEWAIMKVLWDAPGLTANEVADKLASSRWHLNTVRTMLDRLQKKGVVEVGPDRPYRYFALLTREECVKDASESFLAKVFDGALTPLVAHFVKESPLSQQDKVELERILEKYKSEEKP